MKPWLRRTLIGVAGLSLLATAVAATSGCASRHHGPMNDTDVAQMKERLVERAGRQLDLDDAQKARLNVLADRLQDQRKALMAGGTNPRAEFAALFAGPAFDRAQALALVEAKTAAVSSGSPAVIAALGDFYDNLRPEQQQKLRELMSRGGGRHGWRG